MRMNQISLFIILLSYSLLGTFLQSVNEQKKVYFINSYHEGYGSSDDVMEGVVEGLEDKVLLKVFFMDTKRNSNSAFIEKKINEALQEIKSYKPDIIIAADDNAIKYIIAPFFKDHKIPVIFCGVNWSSDQYGLPTKSVTGMIEVLPFKKTVDIVKQSFPKIESLTVLSENTTSELKNKEVMQPLFDDLKLHVSFSLVDEFEEWKVAFLEANKNSDLIYIPTNGAIKNWNIGKAKSFVEEHISKPVITCDDFMMPYAVFGLTKVAKEQGEWAAETALKILNGAKASDFPITKNSKYVTWLNQPLSEIVGFKLHKDLMSKIKIIK